MENLKKYWSQLYPGTSLTLLDDFFKTFESYRVLPGKMDEAMDWYKDAIVYSLYVDLFNDGFDGLKQKLDYLSDLGVTCLWLLPVLDSPMRDAGFDIKDYYNIRADLLKAKAESETSGFIDFLGAARQKGIRVIFDVAINHVSEEHPWFLEAKKGRSNPYRNFFIWSNTTEKYQEARIIFKGIESSNWEKSGEEYFFHRFFNFQPDLNYRNPEVLLAMCRVMLYWQSQGVDGFRADAIPYIWKEEGTECENLPLTHVIIKFFRAILDYCKPGTLLLAEACQLPVKVVEYLGNGDECHAAYHFPLMPRIFKALAEQNGRSIREVLSPDVTPALPENAQWFTFLRCHDELSLELVYVSEAERKYIHNNYCHQPEWDFRLGEGISARLAELMQQDYRRILLAYSIILTLPGTPVIYYGDEFAKLNDMKYYHEAIQKVGKDDTRFLVRGHIDWDELSDKLKDANSLSSKVLHGLRKMIHTRNEHKAFGRGKLEFLSLDGQPDDSLFVLRRTFEKECLLIMHNLSDHAVSIADYTTGQNNEILKNAELSILEPYGFRWFKESC
ncbi:MAG: alpha-amylase family glycosyl hydrolase [Bacteroidota bacterium]